LTIILSLDGSNGHSHAGLQKYAHPLAKGNLWEANGEYIFNFGMNVGQVAFVKYGFLHLIMCAKNHEHINLICDNLFSQKFINYYKIVFSFQNLKIRKYRVVM
jgi:hypothetical protein